MRAPLVMTVASIVRSAVSFGFSVLSIFALGTERFGAFAMIWSFCSAFLFMYGSIGMLLVSRLVEARSVGDQHDGGVSEAALVTASLLLSLGIALLFVLAAIMVAGSDVVPSRVREWVPLCLAIVGLQVITAWSVAGIEGSGRVEIATLLPIIGPSLSCLFIGIATHLNGKISAPAFLGALMAAYFIEMLVSVALALVWTRYAKPGRGALAQIYGLVAGGIVLQGANVVAFALDPFMKSVLLASAGPSAVAAYDLTAKTSWGMLSVFSAFSRLLLQIPSTEIDRQIAALAAAAHYTWVPALYTAAGIIALLSPVFSRLTDIPTFLVGTGLFLSLATMLLMIASAPAYMRLISFGEQAFIFRNQMYLAVGNIVGGLVLVPRIGYLGAYAGLLLATALNFVLISARLAERLPIFTGLLSLGAPRKWQLGGAIALCAAAWYAAAVAPAALAPVLAWLVAIVAGIAMLYEPLLAYVVRQLRDKHQWR